MDNDTFRQEMRKWFDHVETQRLSCLEEERRQREALLKSARAKLTIEEWEALYLLGYEDGADV